MVMRVLEADWIRANVTPQCDAREVKMTLRSMWYDRVSVAVIHSRPSDSTCVCVCVCASLTPHVYPCLPSSPQTAAGGLPVSAGVGSHRHQVRGTSSDYLT